MIIYHGKLFANFRILLFFKFLCSHEVGFSEKGLRFMYFSLFNFKRYRLDEIRGNWSFKIIFAFTIFYKNNAKCIEYYLHGNQFEPQNPLS